MTQRVCGGVSVQMKSEQIINLMDYLNYNREERDLCSHLFRLFLENQTR